MTSLVTLLFVLRSGLWQLQGAQPAFLEEFWESLKRVNDWNLNLRPEYGLEQVLAMPAGD
eukprot:COSAG06_NODE_48887_length_329_cov_0.656522_2_plen_59_part_01